ncbi:MAG: TonB-dependent receptor, partial [Candidatus Aminicenantes bacterium]|nr:TonB-dependent receptor [Candidatus Aminicenantes bacterium]
QIDGAQNNDLFGLDLSGTPGGQAESTPISLDVVQEFQIVLAPYDVRQGGFTGGGINVITKSGTNEFHGSVYYEGRNESLVGNGPSDYEFAAFSDVTYGVSLGGPIIKNKLFFFFNAEKSLAKTPEDIYIDGSGADYDFGHKAEADRIISILKGYGYDPGGYDQVTNETESQKIFFRLDWNINDKHRLTLRNNYVKSSHERLDRSNSRNLWLGNAGRVYENTNNSTVLQLNSNFSEKLFNEFILNITSIHDDPTYMGDPFPNINVDTGTGVSFTFGSEEYRVRNDLKQDLIEITDNLTLYSGKHTYIFGTHNEFFGFYNVFIQREFGKYEFDSIDDFEA